MVPFAPMLRVWLALLLVFISSPRVPARGNAGLNSDPTKPGPCGSSSFTLQYDIPDALSDLGKSIPVTFTVPGDACKSPAPVVFFYNGFQASASDYTQYAVYAATNGYVVVQYDLNALVLLNPSSISDEVKLFRPLLLWVAKQSRTKTSPLYRRASVRRVLTAGHSRGGKLAALVLGTYFKGGKGLASRVVGGYLIDPVDSSSFNPISPGNPSGAAAIKAAGAPVAVVGAGITGSCNPEEGNYRKFYAAGAPGSWQILIPGASHVTFVDAGPISNQIQDGLCGAGTISRPTAAELTEVPMIAWFRRSLQLPALQGKQGPVAQFAAWVKKQEAAGLMQFTVKRQRGRALLEAN